MLFGAVRRINALSLDSGENNTHDPLYIIWSIQLPSFNQLKEPFPCANSEKLALFSIARGFSAQRLPSGRGKTVAWIE